MFAGNYLGYPQALNAVEGRSISSLSADSYTCISHYLCPMMSSRPMPFFPLTVLAGLALVFFSCKKDAVSPGGPMEASIQLEELPSSATGITFANTIQEEGMINIFTWHFLYNGAGVAAGDINNDGLPDLYFAGNMVPDKLYLNKGNFQFEDITANAGISTQVWSSGVTMADVNADGLLDIYVSKNSPTGIPDNNRNKLYINQGHNLFREQAAQYGLDDIGFSTQATFFDVDQDGDLDMLQVNQPFDEFARLVNKPDVVARYPYTDRLYTNQNGKFVSDSLPVWDMYYGLGVVLGDFDLNGWTDAYVCNDYHHRDRLFMNTNGRLSDDIQNRTGHISFYSMGCDAGDINEDGWSDLFTLDMAFEDYYKSKTNMGSMDPDRFWGLVNEGQHYQYMQNALQVNMGNGYFSEEAQIAGISKTDWSYSTLFADLDLDADQDILITNGVLRDLQNNDFNKMVKDRYKGMVGPDNFREILKSLPSNPVPNIIYANDGGMTFTKLPPEAGFKTPGFSHGMIYSDLDGDGKLDVVINNMNATASVYKNTSTTNGHYLKVSLKGPGQNLQGLGCSVVVYTGDKKQIQTMQTSRGYFSAVEAQLYFGLGTATGADSIKVFWKHDEMTVLKQVKGDRLLTVDYAKEKKIPFRPDPVPGFAVTDLELITGPFWEKNYNDYKDQVLLPYKLSQNGPHISTGDVNGDGRTDFFIGGIMEINEGDAFKSLASPALEKDKEAESQESAIIDVDGDGDMDLVVVSGSNEFPDNSPLLAVRLYLNDGKGNLSRAGTSQMPDIRVNGQCIEAFDADGDKDLDLFIGGRLVSGRYGMPGASRLLINNQGKFADRTEVLAPFFDTLGMVTDAVSDDIDRDGDIDLLVVGEWMAPTWLINDGKGSMTKKPIEDPGSGLWWTVEKGDFDQDGDQDFLLGNLGWNNKFGGSRGTKLELYANDMDQNGDFDVVLANNKGDHVRPVRGRECSSQEVPYILNKFPTYDSFARAELTDIYPATTLAKSEHRKLSTMSSVYLKNNGDGTFEVTPLPLMCQAGPVKSFYVDDINRDGHLDFLYAGNHLPTEVETARYDGLYPGVALGDGKGGFVCYPLFEQGKLFVEDNRDIQKITLASGQQVYLFANNNGPMRAISFGK